MKPRSLPPSLVGAGYVVAGAFCISFAPLFVRMDDVGPTAVAFYRLLWGALALFVVALLRGDRILPGRSTLGIMLLAALLFTGDLASWHQSILYVGPGLATILCNFQVFFLAAFGVAVYKERLSRRMVLSIPLAFAGLWLLLEIDIAAIPDTVAAGLIIGLISALFYAGYTLTLRQSQSLTDRLPAVSNMAIISLFGMAFSGVLALLQGQSLVVPSLRSNLLLIFYGVGCQALGWLLLSKGLPRLPASRAGLLMLSQPALTFIWDVLFCDRQTGAAGYAGAVLALFAIGMGALDKSAGQNAAGAGEKNS